MRFVLRQPSRLHPVPTRCRRLPCGDIAGGVHLGVVLSAGRAPEDR
jgi:hypothetical protein